MAIPDTRTELVIPKGLRDIFATIVLTLIVTGFMGSTICLAVYNLVNFRALILSALWLLLCGVLFYALFTEFSIRHLCLSVVGLFALRHFIEVIPATEKLPTITLGFQFFGKRFYYFRVLPQQIDEVNWNMGQVSGRYGKDMNDWQVALWLDRDALRIDKTSHPAEYIYLFGPIGAKEEVELFGLSVVEFLQDAGALCEKQTQTSDENFGDK